jgi:hypothetical protein
MSNGICAGGGALLQTALNPSCEIHTRFNAEARSRKKLEGFFQNYLRPCVKKFQPIPNSNGMMKTWRTQIFNPFLRLSVFNF